jgi:predicted HTH transcriptional regulator
MTKAELFEMIMAEENSRIEFARDDLHPDRLAKISVAFANQRGGHILLGVEDDETSHSTGRSPTLGYGYRFRSHRASDDPAVLRGDLG